ncbi:hypothetical protein N9Y17_03595 [Gammaproteobacteria bacterium]|nr:hypothetical protein [Gammaproteobacteria bacterium]
MLCIWRLSHSCAPATKDLEKPKQLHQKNKLVAYLYDQRPVTEKTITNKHHPPFVSPIPQPA